MSEPLLTENGQRRRDAVKNPFDVDVYHLLPFLDAQVVEWGDWSHAGIVDENVKFTVPVTRQQDEFR